MPVSGADWDLAQEVCQKTIKDVHAGRAREPVELHELDLTRILLVEAFRLLVDAFFPYGAGNNTPVRGN